jgi:anti-anti-sigma factor
MTQTDGITVERFQDRARVSVTGDLDLSQRDRFIAEMAAAAETGTAITLDLRELESIDSTGLSSIIQAGRLVQANSGAQMKVLLAAEGSVRRMFELTLLHLTLDVSTG